MKITIEYIREFMEKEGCELLTDVYINDRQPLDIIARCGHPSTIRWHSFKAGQGRNCIVCTRKGSAEKRKLSLGDVIKIIESKGCKLLDDNYVDSKTELKILFACNHIGYRNLSDFKASSPNCKECAPSGCVSFFTVHQSKGLEFPVVVVGSLEATPRKQFTRLTEILESGYLTRPPYEPLEKTKYYDFRRLFYTAFSRAQNLLVLACHEKDGRGKTPSKYFAEQFEEVPSWRAPEFIPANLPLEKIKDITLKQEYSFTSHLTLFENCAEQYRFYRELEFAPIRTNPILFGTLVHQTIEDIHKAVLRGEESKLSEQQVAAWFDTNYAFLTKKERVYLASYVKNIALEQVLRYYQRNQRNWSRIKDSEVDVSLVKDEYILKGTIDLIVGENQTVELIDFKSEKKPDVNNPADREKLERYRRQLEVYAHIVEERTGHIVSKAHLYYTSEEDGNPYITYPKDSRAIEKTIAVFDQVVHRIEKRDFSIPERPTKICRDCDMRFYCDARNWKFRKKL